jgi:putative phage-type endonuclease
MKDLFEEENSSLNEELLKANTEGESAYEQLETLKQGSKAWFYARLGIFTGSKFPEIMIKGRGEPWGATSLKVVTRVYIERDLSEIGKELYVDELFNKRYYQTEWGNKYQSYAEQLISEKIGIEIIETGFELHKEYPFIGGSFDGKVLNQNDIIEIKCPYDIYIHEEYCTLDEIPKNFKYYGQIQGNIWVANADGCYFASYDPRRTENKIKIIYVERDDEYISHLKQRILDAEKMLEYMNLGVDAYGAMLLMEKAKKDN